MNGVIFFEVISTLGINIRTTHRHWQLITRQKHLEIKGREREVIKTLEDPDEVRKSKKDSRVYLYYRKSGKYFYCVVAKHLNGKGFVVTAYLTKNVKDGERIWKK